MKKLGINDILETSRCLIKIPEELEAEYMWNLITKDVTEHMLWDKGNDFSHTIENIKKTRKKVSNGESWDSAIYDKATGKCIGRCGIVGYDNDIPAIEIGYWLAPKYWGKGYIPECVQELLRVFFKEFKCENACICADSNNMKSRRVAEKCGFTLDGIIRKERRVKGTLQDVAVYTLSKEEYLQNN